MTKQPLIFADQSYTFADYFKLNGEPDEIFSYFGYNFECKKLNLPKSQKKLENLPALKSRLENSFPYVSLTSEMAKREFLIAPILMELIYYTRVKIKVEYALTVNDQLKGNIDYYLQADNQLLIIEAKNADLEKGFIQLGTELIAFDIWSPTDSPLLYGAVSVGNIWQLAILQREEKKLVQDINLYRVPADLEELFRILVAIIRPE